MAKVQRSKAELHEALATQVALTESDARLFDSGSLQHAASLAVRLRVLLHNHGRWIPFERWWNNPVLRDAPRRSMSRRELVCHVADTDGGAHVDPGLAAEYSDLSRGNSLGWFRSEGEALAPLPSPIPSCIRQITHEVLLTLRAKAPADVRVSCGRLNGTD